MDSSLIKAMDSLPYQWKKKGMLVIDRDCLGRMRMLKGLLVVSATSSKWRKDVGFLGPIENKKQLFFSLTINRENRWKLQNCGRLQSTRIPIGIRTRYKTRT